MTMPPADAVAEVRGVGEVGVIHDDRVLDLAADGGIIADNDITADVGAGADGSRAADNGGAGDPGAVDEGIAADEDAAGAEVECPADDVGVFLNDEAVAVTADDTVGEEVSLAMRGDGRFAMRGDVRRGRSGGDIFSRGGEPV